MYSGAPPPIAHLEKALTYLGIYVSPLQLPPGGDLCYAPKTFLGEVTLRSLRSDSCGPIGIA
jgi:hypothetical protein